MAVTKKKKMSGSCMNCGRSYSKLVSYCPSCIKKEVKKYEKRGWTRR